MSNVMAALPNIGGALCEIRNSIPCTTLQTLTDAYCSIAVQ